jgi:drug/metabolite transporter (DMT)-like permease
VERLLDGVLGFAAAFGFANWGMARSTATNAALLITVEPISLILLSPVFLGERLTRRELVGAVLTSSARCSWSSTAFPV